MTTLSEIAEAAGVHVMTASKALNGGSGNTRVAPQTAERIRRIAARLGYVRNVNAARLRAPESRLVGFAGGDLRNPFFAEWQMFLEHALEARGLELITTQVLGTGVDPIQGALHNLRQQGVRALGYWSEQGKVAVRDGARKLPPTFHLGTRPVGSRGVWFDLEAGLNLLVERLVEGGARKLGYFAPAADLSAGGEMPTRLQAFQRICQQYGLPEPCVATYAGDSWDLGAAAERAAGVPWREFEGWVGFNDVASLALLMRRPASLVRRVVVAAVDGTAAIRAWWPAVPHLDLCHPAHASTLARVIAERAWTPVRVVPRLNPEA